MSRRTFGVQAIRVAAGIAVGGFVAGCRADTVPAPQTNADNPEQPTPVAETEPATETQEITMTPEQERNDFIATAGKSMLARGQASRGGIRWASGVQGGNYQTDKDVGAAGTATSLLDISKQFSNDPIWLQGAEQGAAWLMAVAKTDENGKYWHDTVNDMDQTEAERNQKLDAYTSADDGPIGIGNFFRELYGVTQKVDYKQTAIEAAQWTMAQAKNYAADGEDAMYGWQYAVGESNDENDIRTGIGEGISGILISLAAFYEQFKDSDPAFAEQCRAYIEGGVRYLDTVQNDLNAYLIDEYGYDENVPSTLPERVGGDDGNTAMNSGYLSGAAGYAFMYLKLYQVFGDEEYRLKAEELYDWLEDDAEGPLVNVDADTITWKMTIDPEGGDVEQYATGFEEGAPGIIWSYIQAYRLTGDKRYLVMAGKGGNWLISVAIVDADGDMSWRKGENADPDDEDQADADVIHTNLNNGAAGAAIVLHDLAVETGDQKYADAANAATNWIIKTAIQTDDQIGWSDIEDGKEYRNDDSLHWGSGGIIKAIIANNGGTIIDPGMHNGFSKN